MADVHSLALDTIVAIATAPGPGGLGIVRLSGPAACTALEAVLRLRAPMADRRATLAEVLDRETGKPLDLAILTWFAAPRSYTGEHVVELSVHGAPVLLHYLLAQAVAGGARLAGPGEFTERAFLAGRLDLTQAEAVHDLVAASTLMQVRVAAAQLHGSVARQIAPAKDALLRLIAALEAPIDFAEDEVPRMPAAERLSRLAVIRDPLEALARGFTYGRMLRSGATLAIVGRPNAGKSSLFNRLLERERAIVTAEPGTTRDVITETIAIDGIPAELLDTAGLRLSPASAAEAEGIKRSRAVLVEADVVLLVLEAAALGPGSIDHLEPQEAALLEELRGRPAVVVANKADLLPMAPGERPRQLGERAIVYTSATTGQGIEALRAAMREQLVASSVADSAPITNLRQQGEIGTALAALSQAEAAFTAGLSDEFPLVDLAEALSALDQLTGQTDSEEVLRRIFSEFCIGK